ncbi:5-methyltetrahydrofolate--homocysteine methyltransferase [Porphyromonadaceae bacterium NLAE-zl-C104]|jgi:methanogenic corrinoid protein MtbC1|uniref:cobalamin B12-binding domain-containing protein n=1 Tax=Proteiniphilum sp. X52 TaxID=2382159 RepID=UPI000899F9E6|nr:corrinoid protein [Proteiniphilum sp. X52]RNC66747.1 cobalamin-binding protein [Proteiniphilum sp. X52]SDZ84045.1 5-methyltetrahydrofolate--homocysteine methyltransferase [Porphyromonadaceae bacterium KH3R12]SFS71222.1 5-methyltetrahydrofolate--homocysteine methyltransferase [Porphyromonadaceae bacterium NLAE-zl-C104]SFU56015.1 5-methyltetrahydrofolate--homocysteine methyltransferase [Porphyromonadaceae bacterium KHP3R9]
MKLELINKLFECVEFGKININSPYPPQMKGLPGADEITQEALVAGVNPDEILNRALIAAMNKVGEKFTEKKIFVPQMLLSAKAMNASMNHLKPYFADGSVKRKGVFIVGTVFGDLHDIGKNLLSMMVEGAGWEVIDLGIDVNTEAFVEKVKEYPDAVVGISALLTTTMVNIEPVIKAIKQASPATKVIVGGAPLTAAFAASIGADAYGKNPREGIIWLDLQSQKMNN